MAKNTSGKLTQSTDIIIEALFSEAVTEYVEGRKTKEQAIRDFRQQVQRQLNIQ